MTALRYITHLYLTAYLILHTLAMWDGGGGRDSFVKTTVLPLTRQPAIFFYTLITMHDRLS